MPQPDKLVLRLNDQPPREITNARKIRLILFLVDHLEWFKQDNWSCAFNFGVDEFFTFEHKETGTIRPKRA